MSDRIAVMSLGKIQQIGDPHEIYEKPVNRFVADFIGDTNFLEAEITGIEDDFANCQVSNDLSFKVKSIAKHNIGDKVTLALRPEKISLAQSGEIQGKITKAVYLGTDISYSIEISDDITLSVRDQIDLSGHARFAEGDQVGVGLSADAVRMLLD
jgi:spermidine/putrescine transport system ATP-binding protein